ncbi:hypothetical protein [Staphylococcus equorum]|uniref:hypothetical protein n=1 Tax=Staphylococcus equorum TaxID=246432 RepID=UPI00070485D9|nr:hypothetical protein [Staphylococcus equorum]ALM56794.1 hypothetical protein SE1039_10110 [Staphylococcus equorum]
MARKEITTPLDLNNMDNHNGNYDELYRLIDETDRRISEDMWEEIKDANTMTMLEPLQTASELPTEAPDKSLITVIDEQRVYTYFQDEWQPFNEIDLDPFEPFKTELQTMIDNHEAAALQLLEDMQSSAKESLSDMETEHDNAVTEITGLTNDFNTDFQAKMDAFASDYQTKSDQLLADYNSYSSQIDTNTTNSLSDIDTAKNSALTELENFQNTDTSNWQKYKLTEDNGARKRASDIDPVELDTGYYQIWNSYNMPVTTDGSAAYWNVDVFSAQETKQIRATLSGENRVFQKNIHKAEDLGWKELSSDDSGWIPFDLINGAVGDTAFKASGDNGFNCAYRIIEKDGVSEKKLRINAKNVSHRQVIAQLPDGFAKNLQYHFVRVPVDLGLTGMIGVYPNGKIYIYVNADKQTEWESRSGDDVYFYGEVNWID